MSSAVPFQSDRIMCRLQDKKVHLESLSSETGESVFDDNRGEVNSLTFSPDGRLLAAGDVSGLFYLPVPSSRPAHVRVPVESS